MTPTLVLILLITLAYCTAARAHSEPFGAGSPTARVSFLEHREAHHRYVCRNGGPFRSTRWHCKAIRWTLRELRESRAAIHRYQYAWHEWLPDKWARVGACETGGGRRPGNWDHANSSYVSAFGISRQAYDEDAAVMGAPPWNDQHHPTPRQQYKAALGHYKLHGGFSGWGCRGA